MFRADIKSRAQWISSMVYCGVMSREQYEDMNDGPALLNEFLTPTNEWTEANCKKKNDLQMESKDYIKNIDGAERRYFALRFVRL
jgi:hypothetical protein